MKKKTERKIKQIEVSVEDSGIGMTPEEKKNLFERFAQANSEVATQFGGSGLGLAISQSIVEMMGGKIDVVTQKGVGTKFFFRIDCDSLSREDNDELVAKRRNSLGTSNGGGNEDKKIMNSKTTDIIEENAIPLIYRAEDKFKEPIPASPQKEEKKEQAMKHEKKKQEQKKDEEKKFEDKKQEETKKKRVLIVEDNVINQKILARMLTAGGYEHSVAENGLIGLEMYIKGRLDTEGRKYNIVLMDVEMPIMNGLESTEKIREYEKEHGELQTAILGLSGNAREEQINNAISSGMNGYITKPYEKATILKKIEELTS